MATDPLLADTQAEMEETMADNGVETIAEDDWGAAMAEQASSESAAIQDNVEKAQVFTEFTPANKLHDTQNDIDFILDIPVQLTV
jgi:flagellar motor switch protein FliN/FliY